MAQQVIPGGMVIPSYLFGNNFTFSSIVIDASGEKVAFIFMVPETGTIDTVEFRVGTVTVNVLSSVRISLQDLNLATGDPDGTQDQFRDIAGTAFASNTWMVPGLITSDGTDTGVKRSVTRGDYLAVVIEYQTFTALDSIQVSSWTPVSTGISGIPHLRLFTSSWAGQNNDLVMGLKYSDGVYRSVAPHVAPWDGISSVTFTSGSTPDERGLKFSLPVPCVVRGAALQLALSTDVDIAVKLYDTNGSTVLASTTMDGNVRQATAQRTYFVPLPETALAAGSVYRLTVVPQSALNMALYHMTVNSVALLDTIEGGQSWHYTQRTDGGAWTDTTTQRPLMGLWIDSFDDGAGGGGGGGPLIGGRLIR